MLIQLAIVASQCVVSRNVAGMSHGRFQSFHHHVLVIVMSCMTRWRLARLVFTHRTAGQQPKNTARTSSRFIVFLLYHVPCIWSILQVFFLLCRVAWRFVATPPVARLGWREKTRQRFPVSLSDIAMAGQQVHVPEIRVINISTFAINLIGLATLTEMLNISFTKTAVSSHTLSGTF